MANILDVAKRAGVAPTTAKRAIHQPHLLKPETLERVRKAIQELGYEPDQVAGGLRRGRTQTIGLMVGNIVEPFFASLTRSIARAVRARGYALMIADSEYDSGLELQNLKLFRGQRVSGLIIRSAFGSPNLDYLKQMHERGTYIVEIDHFYPNSPFSYVMLDGRQCVFEGVRYLYGLGHRRIAALGDYHPVLTPDERSRVFPEAMQAVGLSPDPRYRRTIERSEEAAYQLTLELMRLPEPPTALFSLTGSEAAGAFRALRELGLAIPQDVSLLTFDNYSWTSLVTPPLDVIEQPVEEMGRAAVEIVLEAVESRSLDKVVRRRFPGKLIRRGSCGPPNR
ncbi:MULTISPECIES: LacI family DNA-binding transcriptional regulator [unclassified Meiothermus]|uniref:LacI family DNA-binding transcriptional regulator n=1 Tax=unclassified Meiothermus TaxID=370471 RepID=UPI000D7C89C0|nr:MULTISPECIES: LacI family DNA-binding transcriptional regulator [unclassified Meiothermus]PZA06115.1 LacI family transcriptional regulator [Meiothermus sp. Pnk-1]RYM35389.1 LacI family transcriptional regulator [Meiothermus sp. PNK-Is4]